MSNHCDINKVYYNTQYKNNQVLSYNNTSNYNRNHKICSENMRIDSISEPTCHKRVVIYVSIFYISCYCNKLIHVRISYIYSYEL